MRVRLKHRRLAQRLGTGRISQNAWAVRLGLDSGHLSKLVNGQRPYPNARTRRKLLEGLGLAFEDLFEVEVSVKKKRRRSRPGARLAAAGRAAVDWNPSPPKGESKMGGPILDLRYAFRQMARRPAVNVAAIITLALGIGANSTFFSLLNRTVLQPLPYRQADRLVQLWLTQPERSQNRVRLSPADFVDYRSQSHSFEQLSAYFFTSTNWTGGDRPERLSVAYASPGFFSMLGVQPRLGRVFQATDEEARAEPVVILSRGMWQGRLGGDPACLGKSLVLSGTPHTVIGILPQGFSFGGNNVELWIPFKSDPRVRGRQYLRAIGRLREGVSLDAADSDARLVADQAASRFPDTNSGKSARLVPLHEELVREVRGPAWILQGVVVLVLLIACANVANLLLARSVTRGPEIALRFALGAGRLRILRQAWTESLLLASLGGLGGLLLAYQGIPLLVSRLPSQIPQLQEVRLDAWVFGFAFLCSLVTGLLFGSVVAAKLMGSDLQGQLKPARRTSGIAGPRTLQTLVASEVGLAAVLLVAAGLMMQSMVRLARVDPGFDYADVLSVEISLSVSEYPSATQWDAFFDRLASDLRATPGIESVGTVLFRPMGSSYSVESFAVAGSPERPMNEWPSALTNRVDAGYFKTMGVPVLGGRNFGDLDRDGNPLSVIVSQGLARRYWPGQSALGERMTTRWGEATIVGVAGDVVQEDLNRDPFPHIYLPFAQASFPRRTLVVRSGSDPKALRELVRRRVAEVDPNLPVFNVSSLEEVYAGALAPSRDTGFLIAGFALAAAFLAVVGLYAVISYSTSQRTHELGVRMTLGAGRSDLLRLVVRSGLRPTVAGLTVGLGAAALLTRALAPMLYEVDANDPWTFAGVAVLFLAVAVAALLLPARRSTKVDPVIALRYE